MRKRLYMTNGFKFGVVYWLIGWLNSFVEVIEGVVGILTFGFVTSHLSMDIAFLQLKRQHKIARKKRGLK